MFKTIKNALKTPEVRKKIIGTNNPRNVVYATLEGLKSMQTVESVAKKRGKKVEEIM